MTYRYVCGLSITVLRPSRGLVRSCYRGLVSRDRGVEARGRGDTEAFENYFEARPRRGVGRPRGGLERPRPHPYFLLTFWLDLFRVVSEIFTVENVVTLKSRSGHSRSSEVGNFSIRVGSEWEPTRIDPPPMTSY